VSLLLVGAVAVLAALVQIGPLSLFTLHPLAVPLLPVAVIAGWAAVRRPGETWPALLLAPVVMGSVSQVPIGLFVVALWPAAALAALTRRIDRDPVGNAARRLPAAALAAVGAVAWYSALLALAAGRPRTLLVDPLAVSAAALATALIAAAVALAVWPWRPRPRGLFE
jgi:hypothetical protein